MSDNTRQSGYTLVELMITLIVTGIMVGALLVVTFSFFGNTIRNNNEARLAVESQNILRSIVEELRVSSGIRDTNANPDPNTPPGGWTTSNAALVLILATPALDGNNDFVHSPVTGQAYLNEIVYYAQGSRLYKRYLIPSGSDADGNRFRTSCPTLSSTCAQDVLLSEHFKSLDFTFYDQNNSITTTLTDARSIILNISMEEKAYGNNVTYNNAIRMTLRNNQL